MEQGRTGGQVEKLDWAALVVNHLVRGLGQNNQISSGSKIGNSHHPPAHHNQLLGFKAASECVGGPGGWWVACDESIARHL